MTNKLNIKHLLGTAILSITILSACCNNDPSATLLTDSTVTWDATWIGKPSPEDVRTGEVSLPARYFRTTFEGGKTIKDAKPVIVEQKTGENLEIFCPDGSLGTLVLQEMRNGEGEPISVAPHAQMIFTCKSEEKVPTNAILRRRINL